MSGLLIIAHAPLASALAEVARHTYPDCAAQLQVLDVTPQMTADDVEKAARPLLELVRDPEALIMTDVFGATPCNAAQRLIDSPQLRLVAGVSVPMLWRTLCYRSQPLDDLLAKALAGGAQGVMAVAVSKPQTQAIKPGRHEQDNTQDQ